MKTIQESKTNPIKPSLHKSVLIEEVIEHLNLKKGGIYVDATFGCGGHTEEILKREPDCKVIAIDWDPAAIEKNAPLLEEKYGTRLKVIWGNFSSLYKLLKKQKISKVDGILADFGTSQQQLNEKDGFSFKKDSPLDMRMSKAHTYFNAEFVLNKYSEKDLAKIFFDLGEEHHSKKIAWAIVKYRKESKIKTTHQLANLIETLLPRMNNKHAMRMHPATKVFQALRIFVNKELENINQFLPAALHFLNDGGRFLCISFHSLEDRLIKTFFKTNSSQLNILTSKPIISSPEEVAQNISSRSAKLRVAQKKIVNLS